ncbi:MAG: thiolase family protein [Thermoplasmatota archaeon]
MSVARPVAVVGVGMTPFRTKHTDKTPRDLTRAAVQACLAHAGAQPSDVEAVVFGTMDPFDGVNMPEKMQAGSALGTRVPFMKISTGGTTGLTTGLAGYQTAASGQFDVVLAVATQRVGEAADAQPILNTCVDPILERQSGVGAITVGAIQGTAHMAKYGTKAADFAAVAVKDHENGARNPRAHLRRAFTSEEVATSRMVSTPLHLYECCPRSDGSVAILFAAGDAARRFARKPAWVLGEAGISDSYYLGDRASWADWDSARMCARRAYDMAGITDPLHEIDVAEIYAAFATQEILEVEAFGFAPRGKGGSLLRDGVTRFEGDLPTSPSGGVLCTNPIGATGLVRLAEASLQVMGDAGPNQVADAHTALAHAWGGTAQFHAMMIVGDDPRPLSERR